MKKFLLFFVLLGVLCLIVFCYWKQQSDLVSIALIGPETKASYLVEIADTAQKAEIGLMGRKHMPSNQGMLFIFPYPSFIKMWMKNTYIPLDMIFINSQNQVICLHENAHPMDESIISCPFPVMKVLELNAGQIQDKKIHLGDHLTVR